MAAHCAKARRLGMTHDFQFRKVSSPADPRMRSRTAKEQLEAVLRELNKPHDESVPDADNESAKRDRVLT